MKKIIPILIIVILFTAFGSVLYTAEAQTDSYGLLAPLPRVDNPIDVSSENESALGDYLNPMIRLIIGVAAVLAVVMIVVGGMQYMTSELAHSKEAGKERITNAVLGLLIALGAFALLYTINPDLLESDLEMERIDLEVAINDSVPQTPVNNQYQGGGQTYAVGELWAPRAGPVADLSFSGARVCISGGGCGPSFECVTVGQTGCTSTRGLNPSSLNTIRQLCQACQLDITGGTEFWRHGGTRGTSHQINSSTIDLRLNPALDLFLSGGQQLVNGQRYNSPVGRVLFEGNHWHLGT